MRFLTLAALLILLGCLMLNRLVLGSIPHGWDDASYYFQGQVLASGRVAAPSTPLIDMFWMTNVVNRTDKRFAKYPPGWPALLAPAMAARAPQLANALLAALAAVFIWLNTYRLLGRTEAWTTISLAAVSPFFMFMGSNYLSHMSTACCIAGMLWCTLRSFDAQSSKATFGFAIAAGAFAAVAILARPYSAALGITGTGVIALTCLRWTARKLLLVAAGSFLSLAFGAALFLQYNLATTGHALLTGYRLYDRGHTFLGESGIFRTGLWENVQTNLPLILHQLNGHVWGWFPADLLPMLFAVLFGWRQRIILALAVAIGFFCIAHSAYFYFDQYFGPRLVFETMPWLLMISASGLVQVSRRVRHRGQLATWLLIMMVALSLGSSMKYFAGRISYYSQNYCGQGVAILRQSQAAILENALVLIRTNEPAAYATFAHLNNVNLYSTRVVFARYVKGREAIAMAEFPRSQTLILDLMLEPIAGPDGYADRFTVKELKWERIR